MACHRLSWCIPFFSRPMRPISTSCFLSVNVAASFKLWVVIHFPTAPCAGRIIYSFKINGGALSLTINLQLLKITRIRALSTILPANHRQIVIRSLQFSRRENDSLSQSSLLSFCRWLPLYRDFLSVVSHPDKMVFLSWFRNFLWQWWRR